MAKRKQETPEKSEKFDKKLIGKAFLMCLWVAASVIAVQFLIAYLMLWTLGAEKLSQPVWTAVYSAISYVLAMGLIIFVPPKIAAKKKNQIKNAPSKSITRRTRST